jgi:hypothetical protein
VAHGADGRFVVVWEDPRNGRDIYGQRYDAAGAAVGAEFRVNSLTLQAQSTPSVAHAPDGRFVVAWRSFQGGDTNVLARLFDASGNPIAGDFAVNTFTTGLQAYPSVDTDDKGNFTVAWGSYGQDASGGGIFARRFHDSGVPRSPEFRVHTYTIGHQIHPAVESDAFGNLAIAFESDATPADPSARGVFVQRYGGLLPAAMEADFVGNRVLDPGETAVVAPAWRNVNGAAQAFSGSLANITGPAGMTYTINDGATSYGTVPNGATGACIDCYVVTVSNPPTRPQTHIDAVATETITPDAHGQVKDWTLHVGRSFTDVPSTSPFYRFVETLLHHGTTGGCTATTYCPLANTTRDQMAVFVLVAREGSTYLPPACTTPVFGDVPASSPFCRWIEELARRGVVSGCGGGNYCPAAQVTREQMAIFVLRTLDPALAPPPCGTPAMFLDVPATSPFCRWIEELARRGVVSGCGGGNYCPLGPVTREQMGVFISGTFGLALYGP